MSGPGPPEPDAGPAVEGYLAEVTTRLPGSVRARTGIVAELRSGLLDATDAHRSAGLPQAEAALAAIREFGDPVQVAVGFRAEIAAGQARRVAVTLLVTGPLVGLLWIAAAAASHLGIHVAPLWPWTGQSPGLSVSIYLVAVAAGVTAWAAILGIATTGRAHPLAARQAPPGSDGRGRRPGRSGAVRGWLSHRSRRLRDKLSARTRLVMFASPQNPPACRSPAAKSARCSTPCRAAAPRRSC